MDFLTNPNLKNVAELSTTSSKVLVVDGASNTIKWRSPSGIVTDGGGSTSAAKLASLQFSDPNTAIQVGISPRGSGGTVEDAFPFFGETLTKKIYTLHRVPFKPTNYQWSLVMRETLEFTNDVESIASAVGFSLQASPSNLTSWSTVYDWDLRTIEGFTHTTGTFSFGSITEVYFRIVNYNLNENSLNLNHFNMALEVWN